MTEREVHQTINNYITAGGDPLFISTIIVELTILISNLVNTSNRAYVAEQMGKISNVRI